MMGIKNSISQYFHRLNTGISERQAPEVPSPPMQEKPARPLINVILFIATFFTTTLAGAHRGTTFAEYFMSGFTYSCTLMTILLSHEMGHYFAARRFGIRTSLPYFIPMYFPGAINFGTMGAVIKTRASITSRRALLYIGCMGPVAGFIVSLAAVIYGISISEIKQLPPASAEYLVPIFGDSLLFKLIVTAIHGDIPQGHDIFLSPHAWAGWIGFLITSLNLMPLGQLDGGHILYALMGRKQVAIGWMSFAALIVMAFIWPGWVVWIILTLLILMVAHPPVPAGDDLSFMEKMLGWFCVCILILTFIPVPVKFL